MSPVNLLETCFNSRWTWTIAAGKLAVAPLLAMPRTFDCLSAIRPFQLPRQERTGRLRGAIHAAEFRMPYRKRGGMQHE